MEEATIFEQRVSDEIESCVAKKKKNTIAKVRNLGTNPLRGWIWFRDTPWFRTRSPHLCTVRTSIVRTDTSTVSFLSCLYGDRKAKWFEKI